MPTTKEWSIENTEKYLESERQKFKDNPKKIVKLGFHVQQKYIKDSKYPLYDYSEGLLLSARAINAIENVITGDRYNYNYHSGKGHTLETIKQKVTVQALKKARNCGLDTINEIIEQLASKGVKLSDTDEYQLSVRLNKANNLLEELNEAKNLTVKQKQQIFEVLQFTKY